MASKTEAEILRLLNEDGDKCVYWPYGRDAFGYGRAKVSWSKTRLAHRALCELAHGPAPSDQHQSLHKCGMGSLGCVNPNHLYWGTHRQNVTDAINHGTIARGSKSGKSVLTEKQIPQIREKYKGGMTQRAISQDFGVCEATIQAVVEGRTWRHV